MPLCHERGDGDVFERHGEEFGPFLFLRVGHGSAQDRRGAFLQEVVRSIRHPPFLAIVLLSNFRF